MTLDISKLMAIADDPEIIPSGDVRRHPVERTFEPIVGNKTVAEMLVINQMASVPFVAVKMVSDGRVTNNDKLVTDPHAMIEDGMLTVDAGTNRVDSVGIISPTSIIEE